MTAEAPYSQMISSTVIPLVRHFKFANHYPFYMYLLFPSYAKAFDPDQWITIDEKTAEIKLNKVPDRESPHLVNGIYYAKILAITKGKRKL